MERIQSINPKRIAWCCQDFGIKPEELASVLGIAVPSIERVMAGTDGFTFNQLRKLAGYFGRGIMFFLEPGPVIETQLRTPQFRTLANEKPEMSNKLKSLVERVEKQRDIYVSLREDLDDHDSTWFTPPQLLAESTADVARGARKWLDLTERNCFETYRSAVEARDILVFRSNGYAGKWQIPKEDRTLGFSLYHSACPVIVIRKQSSEARQSFTLMHELGHLLINRSSSIDDERDFESHVGHERTANAFAGYLLVPDSFLVQILDADRPSEVSKYDDWLRDYRDAWGVSGEVILLRLKEARRLSQSQYDDYCRWRRQLPSSDNDRGSRKYRHREPIHVFGTTFVRTVFNALSARSVTLAKASRYLDNLKIKDLHQLEHHIAGI